MHTKKLIAMLLSLVLMLIFTQISYVLLYVGLFCLPILMIYTTSQVIMPIFRKIEKDGAANDGFSIDREGYSV